MVTLLESGRAQELQKESESCKICFTFLVTICFMIIVMGYHQSSSLFKPTNASSDVSLEDLMYHYGSDKSKDDHAYTNLYKMIFTPIRHNVRNLTEIGVAAGQSLQTWYRFFPNADIHGFDPTISLSVQENLNKLKPRNEHNQQI